MIKDVTASYLNQKTEESDQLQTALEELKT
jgi:hypothetical protein